MMGEFDTGNRSEKGAIMRILLMAGFAAVCGPAWAAMPPAEQNALVTRYCAVCHTDAAMNGLSNTTTLRGVTRL
jgi:hypothetical protein